MVGSFYNKTFKDIRLLDSSIVLSFMGSAIFLDSPYNAGQGQAPGTTFTGSDGQAHTSPQQIIVFKQ